MSCNVEYQQVVNVSIDENVYTLNLIGSVFTDGVGTKSDVIYIPDIHVVFEEGVRQSIDVSQYIKTGQMYVPIMFFQDPLAAYIEPDIIFQPAGETVDFYKDPEAPIGSGATGNYIVLIPIDYEQGSIGGISNGQYYTDSRYYSKAEIDSMIAGLDGGEVVKIYPVTVSIAEGSTEATVDVTSYIEQDKSYLPIAVFQQASIGNVLGYCELSHSSSISSMHFYSNGHVVGDLGVHVYLIPIKSSTATTTKGLTNGIGDISSSMSGYQTVANLVTSVDSSSTDSQYPSAKLFYDTCGDIETLINAL